MTHKQNCIQVCKEHLQNLSLAHLFTDADFNHVYRKRQGSQANTYNFGLKAADFIILNSNNKIKEVRHD